MSVFVWDAGTGMWAPSELAQGPFAGLQGGAVAALMTSQVEAQADAKGWGGAVAVTAWFFRPTPLQPLRVTVTPVRLGKRVCVVDSSICLAGENEPLASARVTLLRPMRFELASNTMRDRISDPLQMPVRPLRAPHGQPWFMDTMEARGEGSVAWFRPTTPVVPNAGPLSRVVGVADWAHGVGRPLQGVLADANPDLTVRLARPVVGDWIGLEAAALWNAETGVGVGRATLLDTGGEVGAVSMSVALTAFPKAISAQPPPAERAIVCVKRDQETP